MKNIIDLLKATFQEWNEDKAPRLAAALAYYTVFSIAPFLVVVIAIVGLVFGQEAAQGEIVTQIEGTVGSGAAQTIEELIAAAYRPDSGIFAAVIGVVTLLLGALGVFSQLKGALNTVWDVEPESGGGVMGFIRERLLSFAMLLVVGFLLLASLVISAAITAAGTLVSGFLPGSEALIQLVNFVVSFAVITVLFALIFKYLPDTEIAWGDVWIGAAVTALLFNIGKFALGLYLGRSGVASAYGAAGSLVVLLLWVYYSAQILLLGAEFTQVYARRHGSRRLTHGLTTTRVFAAPRREGPITAVPGALPPLEPDVAVRAGHNENPPANANRNKQPGALAQIGTLIVILVFGWFMGGRTQDQ